MLPGTGACVACRTSPAVRFAVGCTAVAIDCVRSCPLKASDAAPTVFTPLPASDSYPALDVVTRITVELTAFTQVGSDLRRDSPILQSYLLTAVRPDTEQIFDAACKSGIVDIIHLPCGSKLPFFIRRPHVRVCSLRSGRVFRVHCAFLTELPLHRWIWQSSMALCLS